MLVRTIATAALALLAGGAAAGNVTSLTGTWTTKSEKVITGPDFYDPISELLIEPDLPGISFSFTDDGFYEEAFYVVTADPADPGCPSAVLQFQHGTYTLPSNGSIVLMPFAVDGRQLLSKPCSDDDSAYSRYSQYEVYKEWEIVIDEYRGQYRLNMYKANGEEMNPMYLVYRPPMMLPTETMNPTASATPASKRLKIKRYLDNRSRTNAVKSVSIDADYWHTIGVCMMVGGGVSFLFLNRKSLRAL
ncbi:chaperone for protein-folding within the ER, fungal-domain-containing protein [Dipodascopsis tothii]|uniref:chaperone for protein-folding within the ER, fungal-domain-containing protein n=1 Tax=Dipodascopsis tothii TaxID=44089 RepID=UPI0034CE8EFD